MNEPLQTEMDPQSKGPMKWPSSVCRFVRSFFPEPFVEIFWLFFSVEVRASSNLKSDRQIFEENLVLEFSVLKGLRWGFSSFTKNWGVEFIWFFAWVCSNQSLSQVLRLTQLICSVKILFFRLSGWNGSKWAQNENF